MEYVVNSLKEAIDVTIDSKEEYDKNDISLIKTLIYKAIKMETLAFTRTAGAREYVKKTMNNNGIIKELMEATNTISNDINEIIEFYIDKFFRKKTNYYEVIKNEIKEKTDLTKVRKKLRFLRTDSSDEQDFLNNRWNVFSNIFRRTDSSSEELKYNMVYVALEQADVYRDKATILKAIDPTSRELTKMDAIRIVEEHVYNQKLNDLIKLIDDNAILSGLLLQNLFDYIEEEKINKFSLYDLDKELEKITDIKSRCNILIQLLNGGNIEDINLESQRVIVDLLKNTLALSVYTNNKKYIDYEERKLYTGESSDISEDVIHNRIEENNRIANNLIINGKNTTNEDLINLINNLNDKEKYFLANIYVLSRSLKINRDKLDNSILHGTNEQIYVYGLLEKETLIQELKQQKQNTL